MPESKILVSNEPQWAYVSTTNQTHETHNHHHNHYTHNNNHHDQQQQQSSYYGGGVRSYNTTRHQASSTTVGNNNNSGGGGDRRYPNRNFPNPRSRSRNGYSPTVYHNQHPQSSQSYSSNSHQHHHNHQQHQNQNTRSGRVNNNNNRSVFELDGQVKFSLKEGQTHYENLRCPSCVMNNLAQTYKYNGTPWLSHHYLNNRHKLDHYQRLNAELEDFVRYIRYNQEDEILRKATYYAISKSIKRSMDVDRVKYYGSYSSKTYLPVSDIDMVVIIDSKRSILDSEIPSVYSDLLSTIATQLFNDGIIEKHCTIIKYSRVPLLKFYDSLTGLPINITINTHYVMERAEYIRENLNDPRMIKILFFLKFYLLYKSFNQVFLGGIGSYALALMVIRFFQEESTQELIHQHKFDQPPTLLAHLLLGFLARYSDIEFMRTHMISLNDGGNYKQLPFDDNYHPHMPMTPMINGQMVPKRYSLLKIEDHLEPWKNVCCGSFNSESILTDFGHLLTLLINPPNENSSTILGNAVAIVDSFVEYREILSNIYQNWFANTNSPSYHDFSFESYERFIQRRNIFGRRNCEISRKYMEDGSIELLIRDKIEHIGVGNRFYHSSGNRHYLSSPQLNMQDNGGYQYHQTPVYYGHEINSNSHTSAPNQQERSFDRINNQVRQCYTEANINIPVKGDTRQPMTVAYNTHLTRKFLPLEQPHQHQLPLQTLQSESNKRSLLNDTSAFNTKSRQHYEQRPYRSRRKSGNSYGNNNNNNNESENYNNERQHNHHRHQYVNNNDESFPNREPFELTNNNNNHTMVNNGYSVDNHHHHQSIMNTYANTYVNNNNPQDNNEQQQQTIVTTQRKQQQHQLRGLRVGVVVDNNNSCISNISSGGGGGDNRKNKGRRMHVKKTTNFNGTDQQQHRNSSLSPITNINCNNGQSTMDVAIVDRSLPTTESLSTNCQQSNFSSSNIPSQEMNSESKTLEIKKMLNIDSNS